MSGGRALLAVALLPACTLANAVNVCSPSEPAEQQVNVLTEGQQAVESAQALALLPNGRLAAVFTSKPLMTTAPDGAPALQLALLGSDGSPVPACDTPNEVSLANPSSVHAFEPAIAAAETDAQESLVVFSGLEASGPARIFGVFVGSTGCAVAAPFAISEASPGLTNSLAPSVARLGPETFLVTWTELLGGATNPYPEVRARVLKHEVGSVVHFLPTVLDARGGPAALASTGARRYLTAVTATTPGSAAIAWFESGSKTQVVVVVVDDRLAAVSAPPRAIFETPEASTDLQMSGPSLAAAFDGAQLLVAWSLHDAGAQNAKRVQGRFFAPDGRSLAAPDGPDGRAFRFGTTGTGDEAQVAVSALDEGGFVAAWSETGAPGREDIDGAGLRAAAFDVSGARRFAGRACDALDFRLNGGTAGNQTRPALAPLPGGGLAAVWTDDGRQGLDRSGLGVRAAALTKETLFAVP